MPIAVMPIAKGQHGAYQLTLRPARASASKTLASRDAANSSRSGPSGTAMAYISHSLSIDAASANLRLLTAKSYSHAPYQAGLRRRAERSARG